MTPRQLPTVTLTHLINTILAVRISSSVTCLRACGRRRRFKIDAEDGDAHLEPSGSRLRAEILKASGAAWPYGSSCGLVALMGPGGGLLALFLALLLRAFSGVVGPPKGQSATSSAGR